MQIAQAMERGGGAAFRVSALPVVSQAHEVRYARDEETEEETFTLVLIPLVGEPWVLTFEDQREFWDELHDRELDTLANWQPGTLQPITLGTD